jgi:hypothetical protein
LAGVERCGNALLPIAQQHDVFGKSAWTARHSGSSHSVGSDIQGAVGQNTALRGKAIPHAVCLLNPRGYVLAFDRFNLQVNPLILTKINWNQRLEPPF